MAASLDDIIECSVCMTELNNPQILPCQHTFCKACIDQLIARNNRICPICKADFTAQEVKNDFNKVKLMQLLRPSLVSKGKCEVCETKNVSHMCEECEQAICAECHLAHRRFKVSRNHNVISLEAKWNQLKPVYDMQLKNLKEAIIELDIKLSEHSKFERSLQDIEDNALAESQRLQALYIKMIEIKFGEIDDSIRSFSYRHKNEVLELHKKIKGIRTALVSQLEQLIQEIYDKDVMYMTRKADAFANNTRLDETEFNNLPSLPSIKIKTHVDLNINDVLEVSFSHIQSRRGAGEHDVTIHKEAEVENVERQLINALRLTQDMRKVPSKNQDRPDRGQRCVTDGDDWTSVPTKTNTIDPDKLKITKPVADEKIQLGPGGCGFGSWGCASTKFNLLREAAEEKKKKRKKKKRSDGGRMGPPQLVPWRIGSYDKISLLGSGGSSMRGRPSTYRNEIESALAAARQLTGGSGTGRLTLGGGASRNQSRESSGNREAPSTFTATPHLS